MVEIKYCNWTEPNYFQHYSLRRFANIYLNFPYNGLSAVFFTVGVYPVNGKTIFPIE